MGSWMYCCMVVCNFVISMMRKRSMMVLISMVVTIQIMSGMDGVGSNSMSMHDVVVCTLARDVPGQAVHLVRDVTVAPVLQ